MALSLQILGVLALTLCGALCEEVTLKSPRTTIRGDWGPIHKCPPSEYVYAFRLKVQEEQAAGLDNSSVNGIELTCISPQTKIADRKDATDELTVITSVTGVLGNLKVLHECPFPHFAAGFELRSQREIVGADNTAANNLRIRCSNGQFLEGDGTSWGNWTGELNCPDNKLICGLQTQVEIYIAPPYDQTALNNVDIICCDNPLQKLW